MLRCTLFTHSFFAGRYKLPMRLFLVGLLTTLTAPLYAQVTPPAGQNYIITQTPRTATPTVSPASSFADVSATVAYVDGLGRPIQTVQVRGAGNATTDIIGQTSTYDAFGRVLRTYLPAPGLGATGAILADPQAAGSTFYAGDQNPYAETTYETSPLNRPVQQFGAGQNWRTANRRTTVRYGVAAGVLRFKANSLFLYANVEDDQTRYDYFGPHDIARQTTTNEQGQQTIAYTDLQGHTIRRDQVLAVADTLTTVYVYDKFERLTAVIPPKLYRWFTDGGPGRFLAYYGSGNTDNPIFKESAYVYLHDKRSRLTAKHVPNAGWTELVYDRQDRPVMSRDRQDNADGKWRFTKYDGLGRTVMSGRTSLPLSSTQSADDLRAGFAAMTVTDEDRATGAGTLLGYTQRSFPASVPISASVVLVVNQYDVYAAGSQPYQPPGSPFAAPYSSAATGNATGLLTGTLTRLLSNSGIVGNTAPDVGALYQRTVWYDDKGRVLQAQGQNHLGGTDRTDNQYSFAGELQQSVLRHQPGSGAAITTVTTTYSYDHLGRRTQATHAVGAVRPTLVGSYQYDAIGRLAGKAMGGLAPVASRQDGSWTTAATWQGGSVPLATEGVFINTGTRVSLPASSSLGAGPLVLGGRLVFGAGSKLRLGPGGGAAWQRLTYHYHLRGWLRGINLDGSDNPTIAEGKLFAMKLGYDDAGQYNGNIGSQVWVHSRDGQGRSYTYAYDGANRLAGAAYGGGIAEGFTIENVSYDPNGNLTTLNRRQRATFNLSRAYDQLTYTYSPVGNSLTAVADNASTTYADVGDFRDNNKNGADYDYAPDGSLLYDRNRNINLIRYNLLKLPREVVSNAGSRVASYTYSATGEKLRMRDEQAPQVGGQLNALRDYVGPFQYLNGSLFEITLEDGRYTPGGGYEFFHKDHLGNVRESFNGSGSTQYTDYDPLGLAMPALSGGGSSNRLKYNGKEAVGELGTNVLDYGARFYDAQTGRWGVVDPLAEVSRRFSPYVYGNANPVSMIDPDGMISQNASVYYQGQDARDLFGQLLRQQGLSEQEESGDGGPGPKQRANNSSQKGLVDVPFSLRPVAPPVATPQRFSPMSLMGGVFSLLSVIMVSDQNPNSPSASKYRHNAYIYREMSVNPDGSFVQSPLDGAPNGRQMGVRTHISAPGREDIIPGGENGNMVGPDYTKIAGLSASNPPRLMQNTKGTIQGAVRISNLPIGLSAINDHDNHYSVFPVTNMTIHQYQSLLNSVPWRPQP